MNSSTGWICLRIFPNVRISSAITLRSWQGSYTLFPRSSFLLLGFYYVFQICIWILNAVSEKGSILLLLRFWLLSWQKHVYMILHKCHTRGFILRGGLRSSPSLLLLIQGWSSNILNIVEWFCGTRLSNEVWIGEFGDLGVVQAVIPYLLVGWWRFLRVGSTNLLLVFPEGSRWARGGSSVEFVFRSHYSPQNTFGHWVVWLVVLPLN